MPTSGSGTGLITLEPGCQPVVVITLEPGCHRTGTWMPTSGSGTGWNLDANQW